MGAYDVIVADDVLAYLNAVSEPEELRDRIRDDPNFRGAAPGGITLAQATSILGERAALGRPFKTLAEIEAVPGVGRNAFHNVLYSFRPTTDAAALYRSFQSYVSIDATVRPLSGEVLHTGEQFEVSVTVTNTSPPPDRANGVPEVTFSEVWMWLYPTGFTSGIPAEGQRHPMVIVGAPPVIQLGGGESHTFTSSMHPTATAVNDGLTDPLLRVVARVDVDSGRLPFQKQPSGGTYMGGGNPPDHHAHPPADLARSHSFFTVEQAYDLYHAVLPD